MARDIRREAPSALLRLRDETVAFAVDLAATVLLRIEQDERETEWREMQLEMLSLIAVGSAGRSVAGVSGSHRPMPPPPEPPHRPDPPGKRIIRIKPGQSETW